MKVQLSGLSAEDEAFYLQLWMRHLDRTAGAFAGAEPGALPGNGVRDLTSDANIRLRQVNPCDGQATESS